MDVGLHLIHNFVAEDGKSRMSLTHLRGAGLNIKANGMLGLSIDFKYLNNFIIEVFFIHLLFRYLGR